ncbi:MAG: hypothetical protein J6V09_05180 [Clostridia bacterium]|nr:hypothetical protein [Clostridia bacterium]
MKILRLLEKILCFFFWFLLILGFDSPRVAYMTLAAALIHECGHLLVAFFFTRGGISLPKADFSGFKISAPRMSYKEELFVALGGPVLNLVLGILPFIIPLTKGAKEYFELFGLISLLSALSNLLPISDFDGYRIAECILSLKIKNAERVSYVLGLLSFSFCGVATFLNLYLILKTGEGYWIFGVFFASLLAFMGKRLKSNVLRENKRF